MAAHPVGPATLVRLKLHLLRNGLRRSPWQIVSLVVALLYGLGITALAVAGLVALRAVDAETARIVVVAMGSLLVLGWGVVPLVAFGTDATLDPARLALFPVPARRLVAGLLAAGVVGVPGAVTAVVCLATVVTWSRGPLPALVALVAAPIALLTCVALSRLTTTALAGALSGRRSRELVTGLGVLLAVLVGPALGIGSSVLRDDGERLDLELLSSASRALGWTPLGWAFSAPADAAEGRLGVAVAKLALAVAALLLVLLAWSTVLASALVGGGGGGAAPARRVRARASGGAADEGGLLARLERTPSGAVAARSLRYWRRDSRYLTSLVSIAVLPLLVVAVPLFTDVDRATSFLVVGPVTGFMLGWASHDDVAYDGTAVWSHVGAGLPGRADRTGRALAVLLWGLPASLVVTVAGTLAAGRPALLPAMVGLTLAVLGAGQGVSAVASVVAPYKVPEPGANPFAAPAGAAVTSVVVQTLTSAVIVVAAAPTLALVLGTALVDPGGLAAALAWAALLVGAASGALALWAGVRGGGRLFDQRGPELLATLAR